MATLEESLKPKPKAYLAYRNAGLLCGYCSCALNVEVTVDTGYSATKEDPGPKFENIWTCQNGRCANYGIKLKPQWEPVMVKMIPVEP